MTFFDAPGWQWAVEERVNPLEYRLHIWMDSANDREVISGFDNMGNPETLQVAHGQTAPFPGFRIPMDLAVLLQQASKPTVDPTGEISRLEEAVTVERMRVDKILEAVVGNITRGNMV